MKVALDISQSVYETGVSFYTKNLINEILKIDQVNQYLLFGGSIRRIKKLKGIAKNFCINKVNCQYRLWGISPRIANVLFNRIHLMPIDILLGKVDVVHFSDWTQPKSRAFKVTTIHDLVPVFMPHFTPPEVVRVHKMRLRHVFREADRIIVPSEFTKNELLRIGFDDARLRVIYEAAGEVFKPQIKEDIEDVKKKYGIHGDYLLSVGTGKRKNTSGIIKAFDLARAGKSLSLVIVGKPGNETVNARGVRYTGILDDVQLAKLYSGAKALVYTSFYEGFGLPILQAFSCGCPVVASDNALTEEIGKGACIVADPKDERSIALAIKKAISAPSQYIKKGFKRAEKFTWKETALKTINVYKEYLNQI